MMDKDCVEKTVGELIRPTPSSSSEHSGRVYSVITRRQAIFMTALVSAAGTLSAFTAFVYYPSVRSLATDLNVSLELINTTVTTYLIVQAFVPGIFGDLSQSIGRRPVYIIILATYCAASIGLALQRDYAALLVLRMLQSAGASGAVALAFGVIGDIAAPHERGSYTGYCNIGFYTAPALGPVLGGLLSQELGWPSIFVLCAGLSGLLLTLVVLFLFETSRDMVGNGSIPATGLNRTLINVLHHGRTPNTGVERKMKFRMPSMIPCVKLLCRKNMFPLLIGQGVFYMMYACLQATLAQLLEQRYGLSVLQAGLCYLPYGVAGAISSYFFGRVLDHNYAVTAKRHGLTIDKRSGDDLLGFPIEEARLRSIWVYLSICSASCIGYGWAIEATTHLVIPILLSCSIGASVCAILIVCNTLSVDVAPDQPVTASAANNLARCLVAAAGLAAVQPVLDAVGPGWTFTIIGGACAMITPLFWLIRQKGWHWRKARNERLRAHAGATELQAYVSDVMTKIQTPI